MNEKEIIEILKEYKISITKNRIKMIACLLDDISHFHSINEFTEHIESMNVKSIYNNLKVLTEAGLIDTYSFAGVQKYAIRDEAIKKYPNTGVAHIINGNDVVKHLELKNKIFKEIRKATEAKGFDVENIKIFIEAKKKK